MIPSTPMKFDNRPVRRAAWEMSATPAPNSSPMPSSTSVQVAGAPLVRLWSARSTASFGLSGWATSCFTTPSSAWMTANCTPISAAA